MKDKIQLTLDNHKSSSSAHRSGELHMKTLISLLHQKQSYLGMCCLSQPFWQATRAQTFKTSNIVVYIFVYILTCVQCLVYYFEGLMED